MATGEKYIVRYRMKPKHPDVGWDIGWDRAPIHVEATMSPAYVGGFVKQLIQQGYTRIQVEPK